MTDVAGPAPAVAPEVPGADAPGHTENEILIRADLDLVWQRTNDLAGWPDLFTEYAAVDILEQDGRSFLFRLSMHPDESGKIWSWVSRRTLDPDLHTVHAHRVEPGPFEFMKIVWTYRAVPEGTVMRWIQDFRMREDAPIDTAAMTDRINRNSKIQMAVIAERLESAAASVATIPAG